MNEFAEPPLRVGRLGARLSNALDGMRTRLRTLRAGGGATGEADAPDDMPRQSFFEWTPATGRMRWTDPTAAASLTGLGETALVSAERFAALAVEAPAGRAATLLGATGDYAGAYRLARPDGTVALVEERAAWVAFGAERRLIGSLRCLEAERRARAAAEARAECDELTGALTRPALRRALDATIAAGNPAPEPGGVQGEGPDGRTPAAYMLAGIHELGAINADFGVAAADDVVGVVAARLREVLGPDAIVGRVAGTKFGIVLANCDAMEVHEIGRRLIEAARAAPAPTRAGPVTTAICVGSVDLRVDAEGLDGATAMARGEAALDAAKRLGPSSATVWRENAERVSARRRNASLSEAVVAALNDRRVRLAYQPIVARQGDRPARYECLIRMLDPEGAVMAPSQFMPLAERFGLVHLLDRRALEIALTTLTEVPDISLCVNVSMETVRDPLWSQGYVSMLRGRREASRVTVELTETRVIDAVDASIEFVAAVKAAGAQFAIDDFGAGYTSFRNLKALDIDVLKIDGSFVKGLSSSFDNRFFVTTLIDLARKFDVATVAEWVETEEDAALLKSMGVDYLQGYLTGAPADAPLTAPARTTAPAAADASAGAMRARG